jgi:hypothetical protein
MTPGNPGLSMTSVTSTLNTSLSSLFSSTQLETIGNYSTRVPVIRIRIRYFPGSGSGSMCSLN